MWQCTIGDNSILNAQKTCHHKQASLILGRGVRFHARAKQNIRPCVYKNKTHRIVFRHFESHLCPRQARARLSEERHPRQLEHLNSRIYLEGFQRGAGGEPREKHLQPGAGEAVGAEVQRLQRAAGEQRLQHQGDS